tara:strand:- start:84 stop:311 length:228 start_codon:yes stop_codon:yes gene_type:complete
MNYDEQTDAFNGELGALIVRFMNEFDINAHTIVGVLEEKKIDLLNGGDMLFELDDMDSLEDDVDFLEDDDLLGDI